MSTLNVANITDGTTTVGTEYVVNGSAKAWANFNGTGTIAARDSLNVSSLADNGTGNYSVNLSSSLANANGPVCSSDYQASRGNLVTYYNTTSVIYAASYNDSGSAADYQYVQCIGMGDLA